MVPGFIDSHVHLSETLSRAVFPDCLATRAWVFHWAKPFYAAVSGEDEVGVLCPGLRAAGELRGGGEEGCAFLPHHAVRGDFRGQVEGPG